MKLYLSSYNIPTPTDFINLIGRPIDEIKLAVIVNGKDYYDEPIRNEKIEKLINYLKEIGFVHLIIVDLNILGNAAEVKETLKEANALWVAGGNTFNLRYAMKKSGFDSIAKDLIEAGLVYGGDSAGAVVAGPSLKGVEKVDDNSHVPDVIEEGLNLIPFVVIPHIDSEYISEVMRQIADQYEGDQKIELGDNEAVIYENGSLTKLSSK